MKVIGITGGIGSGKSAVLSKISEIYNCRIILSDDAAKYLEEKGQPCYEPLVSLLGEKVLDSEGNIDKKEMARVIFSDENLLNKVNDIVHPKVLDYLASEIAQEKIDGKIDYLFLEAALLIDGFKKLVDELWYVYATCEVRKERLRISRGYTDEKIESIMGKQVSEDVYKMNCDFVIDNSYDLEDSISLIKAHLAADRR